MMAEAQLHGASFGDDAADISDLIADRLADRLVETAQTDDRLAYLLEVCTDGNPTAEEEAEYKRYEDDVKATLESDEAARAPVQLQTNNAVNVNEPRTPRSISREPIGNAISNFADMGMSLITPSSFAKNHTNMLHGRTDASESQLEIHRKRKADFDSPNNR
jgi:hypothetical protein